jgi:hypothetical protein
MRECGNTGTARQATDTHSEDVILIAAPRRQWLRERDWMLLYTYIAFHVRLVLTVQPADGRHALLGMSLCISDSQGAESVNWLGYGWRTEELWSGSRHGKQIFCLQCPDWSRAPESDFSRARGVKRKEIEAHHSVTYSQAKNECTFYTECPPLCETRWQLDTQNYSTNKTGNLHKTSNTEVRSDVRILETSQRDILFLHWGHTNRCCSKRNL